MGVIVEILSNYAIEIIPNVPITLTEVLELGDIKVPIYKTSVNDFYDSLTQLYLNGTVSMLNGSVAVCIGGGFRSPRVNSDLYESGVLVAKHISRIRKSRGLDILSLDEAIKRGKVDENGYLHPHDFDHSIKNLFVTIDLRTSENMNLYFLVRGINERYEHLNKTPKINVIVIPGEESELIKRGKKFEYEVLDKN